MVWFGAETAAATTTRISPSITPFPPPSSPSHLLLCQAVPLLQQLVDGPVRLARHVPQRPRRGEELVGAGARGHHAPRHVPQHAQHLRAGRGGRGGGTRAGVRIPRRAQLAHLVPPRSGPPLPPWPLPRPTCSRWSRSRPRVPTVRGWNRYCPVASSHTMHPSDHMSAGVSYPASRMTCTRHVRACVCVCVHAYVHEREAVGGDDCLQPPCAVQPPPPTHAYPHLWRAVRPGLDVRRKLVFAPAGVAKVDQLQVGAQQARLQRLQVHLMEAGAARAGGRGEAGREGAVGRPAAGPHWPVRSSAPPPARPAVPPRGTPPGHTIAHARSHHTPACRPRRAAAAGRPASRFRASRLRAGGRSPWKKREGRRVGRAAGWMRARQKWGKRLRLAATAAAAARSTAGAAPQAAHKHPTRVDDAALVVQEFERLEQLPRDVAHHRQRQRRAALAAVHHKHPAGRAGGGRLGATRQGRGPRHAASTLPQLQLLLRPALPRPASALPPHPTPRTSSGSAGRRPARRTPRTRAARRAAPGAQTRPAGARSGGRRAGRARAPQSESPPRPVPQPRSRAQT